MLEKPTGEGRCNDGGNITKALSVTPSTITHSTTRVLTYGWALLIGEAIVEITVGLRPGNTW